MLFLPHRPTHTIIEQHNKLILTTSSQILFASLDFLQEYITTHLVSTHPISIAYSPQKSEALIITKDCIMIYWTDWQNRVELYLALYLNKQKVYSFDWQQKCIVYGEFRQYGTKKLTLYNIQNYDEDIPSCFLGHTQYLLTNKRIVVYDHKLGTRKNIEWHDSRQWLPKLTQNKVQLTAFQTYQGNTLLKLCNLCVIIKQAKVMNQKSNDGILNISKQMAVWFSNNRMKIYQIDEYQFIDLGQIQTYQGYYYTSTVYNDKLCLFFYDFKQLQMKTLKLISTEEYKEQEKKKQQRQIMKQSMRDDRSVSEKAISEHRKPLNKNKKQDFASDSQSVRFKGGSMQQALKASINSFKQEVERSLKKQKFVEHPPPPEQKYLKINYDKFMKFPDIKKKLGFNSHIRPGPQLQKPTQLKKSGRGKELSEYEQQQQSPDRVNQLNSHILSTLSSFEVGPTHSRALSNGNTRTGDSQVAFHNQYNNERKQQNDPPKPPNESGKSIVRKMSKIHRQHPLQFEQALDSMVQQIIHQNDAKLFFTEYVRLFNSESTKDRVLKLYRHIQDTPQNKKLMAVALSQFKLNQVPEICLPIEHEVLHVFYILHPSVYIEDLLQPTPQVYQQLIENYFTKEISKQIIKIQDESIDLAHPRNLLNVLLYLNEYFKLQLDLLFEVYAKGMMKNQCCHVLKKIIESNIFDICEVNRQIFQKAAVSVAIQILEQCTANLDIVRPIISLMGEKQCEMFQQILKMIQYCNSCNLIYPISPLFELPQTKESFRYMRDLISNNLAANLINMNISLLFKFISKIENDKYANHYTSDHLKIVKQLCQKFMEYKFYGQAFEVITPVSHIIKRGFIAAILFKYFEGKHANRLVGVKIIEPFQIQTIFKQIIIQKQYTLKRDTLPIEVDQKKKLISWTIFKNVSEKYLPTFSWELSYILYQDILLSNQLVQQSIITAEQFYFLQKKIGHSTQQIRRLTFMQSQDKHLNIPVFIEQSRNSSSHEINPFQHNVNNNQNTLTSKRSLIMFDKKQQNNNNRRSSGGLPNQKQPDSALVSLRLEVYQTKILSMLQEYYKQSPKGQFLKAVNVVDKQRVPLRNIDTYKYLIQSNISYSFQKLIPFCYFVNQAQAWEITQNIIRTQINIDNFWIVYLIINILYQRGANVAKMLIQKIITEEEDMWSSAIELILNNIYFETQFLKKMISITQKRGLTQMKSRIKKFIKEI